MKTHAMNTAGARPHAALRPGVRAGREGWAGCVSCTPASAAVLAALVLGVCSCAQGHDPAPRGEPAGPAVDQPAPEDTAAPAAADKGARGGRSRSIKPKLRKFVKPAGIVTLALVATTVALGFLRRVKVLGGPGVVLKIHKTTGVCALAAGVCHLIIILILHS